MAAAGAWELHDTAKEKMLTGVVDFDTNSFVVRLYTSTSDVGDTTTSTASTVTNEVSNANGYTTGGNATTATVSEASGIASVDFTDVTWTATASGITARFAAVIDSTANEVVAHCLCDATPADVTALVGNQFIVQFHANGLFQLV